MAAPDEGGCHNVHSPLYDFNDQHPDDGRGLLGQPGAARAGRRGLVGSAGLRPAAHDRSASSGEVVERPVGAGDVPAGAIVQMDDGLGIGAEVERRCELRRGGLGAGDGEAVGERRQRDQRIVGDNGRRTARRWRARCRYGRRPARRTRGRPARRRTARRRSRHPSSASAGWRRSEVRGDRIRPGQRRLKRWHRWPSCRRGPSGSWFNSLSFLRTEILVQVY